MRKLKRRPEKPLLSQYLTTLGLTDAAIARLCGLTRTNMARARYKNLNAENSERLSRCLASELGLSEEEWLFLKSEIMGFRGNLVRAYFGGIESVHEEFRVSRHTVMEILTAGREINGNGAPEIARRLKEGNIPACVADDIRSRLGPPRGEVTHRPFGKEAMDRRTRTRTALQRSKPETAEAIK